MRTTFNGGILNTNDPWFLAKITAVCPPDTETYGDCAGYTCSWEQYVICDNMQVLTDTPLNMVTGDCTINQNVAVPINQEDPTALIGSVVLMRQRGTVDQEYNIYEFVTSGGSTPTPAGDTVCFGVKSVSCSNNVLMVTLSDAGGCIDCVGGMAFYKYSTAVEVTTDTNYPLPMNWNLVFGDLADTGLEIDGATWKNNSGAELKLRITMQYYFTPQSVQSQSKWAYIVRNGDVNDVPVAGFVASNQTYIAISASNTMTLANGDYFQPYAFQDGGAGIFVGDPTARVPTTLTIERMCI